MCSFWLIRLITYCLLPCFLQQPLHAYIKDRALTLQPTRSQPSFLSQALTLSLANFNGEISKSAHTREVQWRPIKDLSILSALLVPFFISMAADLYWLENRVNLNVLYEYLSFGILAVGSAISGSLIAQWRRIRENRQMKFEILPIIHLVGLAILYSMIVEKWAWGILELVKPFHSTIGNAVLQDLIDYLFLSLLLATAWALYFYARCLDPRIKEDALTEIREKFLGFYITNEWKWAAWIFMSLLTARWPIISFTFFQCGVLHWNVAFAYGDFPNSEEMIHKIQQRPRLKWIALLLRRLQQGMNQRWYVHYLVNTLVTAYILSVRDFLSRWPPTHQIASSFMIAAGITWTLWLFRKNIFIVLKGQWFQNRYTRIGA